MSHVVYSLYIILMYERVTTVSSGWHPSTNKIRSYIYRLWIEKKRFERRIMNHSVEQSSILQRNDRIIKGKQKVTSDPNSAVHKGENTTIKIRQRVNLKKHRTMG